MTTAILPLWKEALKNLMATSPKPGDVIRQDWLRQQFGIEKPVTAEDQVRASFEYLQMSCEFRSALLEDHCIALKTIPGVGFEIIAPNFQTRWALENGAQRISREISKMARNVAFVDVASLNEGERREHTDGMAKVSTIRGMFNRRKLLGRL